MVSLPAGIAAQAALTQQAIAMSVIKQNTKIIKNLVAILDQALNVPVSGTRGSNFSASV